MFAHPVHLIVGAFEAEIVLADDVVARAAEFGLSGRSVLQPAQFAQDESNRLFEIVGVESGGDDQVAGVVKKLGVL